MFQKPKDAAIPTESAAPEFKTAAEAIRAAVLPADAPPAAPAPEPPSPVDASTVHHCAACGSRHRAPFGVDCDQPAGRSKRRDTEFDLRFKSVMRETPRDQVAAALRILRDDYVAAGGTRDDAVHRYSGSLNHNTLR
jgi:hypothetical protein